MDYYGIFKTNVFSVVDENKFKEIMANVEGVNVDDVYPPATEDFSVRYKLKEGVSLYDENGEEIDRQNKEVINNCKKIMDIEGNIIYNPYDKDGNRLHQLIGDSLTYYTPSTESIEIKSMIKNNQKIYNEYGEVVEYTELNTYTKLFNADKYCVYDKYCNEDIDLFFTKIQQILPQNKSFIYEEVGHEGYKDLHGMAVLVTKNKIRSISLVEWLQKEKDNS